VIGVIGYILLRLDFHPAPILLGFVLDRVSRKIRRSLLISRGDLTTFVQRPIVRSSLAICVLLIAAQIYVWLRKQKYCRGKGYRGPGADNTVFGIGGLNRAAGRTAA